MIKMSTKMLMAMVLVVVSMASMMVNAAGEMKPFILGSIMTGEVSDKIEDIKKSLVANGFQVVGEYAPYDTAHIIAVTNKALKKAAAFHSRAGYIAAQRVAITKVGDEIQVTYTNPEYMAAAYHVKKDISAVTAALSSALGFVKEFGIEIGMRAEAIAGYHYTFGMEYFDEPYPLAEYDNYAQAIAAVEKGLAAKVGGATKVFRIDVPGKKQTIFGVGLSSETTGSEYMDDGFIMDEIDFKEVRSTAHLPYEILVTGAEVEALHARFRIAVNFPDLSMRGENSFFNIMSTPDAIRDALTEAVGGELESDF